MTNRIALFLAVLLLLLAAWDFWMQGAEYILFLSRKLADLIEWAAFWR
ncbi:hypothetical protein AB1M95_10245 [Sulfitobacter sp. LCG007]